jgi:immune inhibitor A
VSTDDGATWSELPVKDAAGNNVTTPDGYGDPNGRMADYGGKKYGLTGTTNGWRHDSVDLTPYAGTAVQLRLRYATDEAFVERGWFADDFEITVGGTPTAVDDVESGEGGWTKTVATFVDGTPLGVGWRIDTGTASRSHYYLAEWRNFDGFDEGLKYAYDTTYSSFGPWKVEKIKYNAPGMLVWYRDTTYGSQNPVLATTYDLPSVGTKGGLLIVDSHFDPLRRSGVAAQRDPSTLNNLPSRPQSSNAAFTTQSTYPFRECLAEVDKKDWSAQYCTDFGPLPGVKSFTDTKGWYPGIEFRGSYYFRDIDASVVVPNGDTEPYTVRIVGKDGKPETRLYGTDLGGGIVLGDGNPTKPLGVELEILKVADDKMDATIWVQPAD